MNIVSAVIFYLVQSAAGTLYYHGHVGDERIDFLIDTGSTYTVLNKEVFNRIDKNLIEYKDKVAVRTSTGQIHKLPHYEIKEMWIGLCRITNVDVLVVKRKSGINLLGIDTLKKISPFSINFDPYAIMTVNC